MQVLYWVLTIFMVLMFMMSLINCVNTKNGNRVTDMVVSIVIFCMIVALTIVKYRVMGG